ncbi:hypothetical protein D477_012101 [Arthrobacter crystallopoietes BAB-32]|uniref:Uncharacterized protein n=2 Tax=Crystallibacter crystallopoietes TaxID=37928 RepID=N1V1V9_9MICC|nr:hypothetical protein D477_012101 [Arthrobacter crystallopoietes BAB-32]
MCFMLAVAAAVVTIVLVNQKVYSPQHQVRAYFDALKDGDGSRALGLLNSTVPDANAALLDGAPLKQSVAEIEDLEVGDPVVLDADRVEVPANYTIEGTPHTTSFELERSGTSWMFFDQWSFVPTKLPTVEVGVVNENEASLNGTRVALPEGKNEFAVFYPGSFEAHFTSEFFAAPVVESVLTEPEQSSGARLSLETKATEKLIDEVDKQVRAFLDGCAEQAVLQPTGCPFSAAMDRVRDDSIDWEITEYPKIAINPSRGSWVMEPLVGTAKLNVVEIDLFTGVAHPRALEEEFNFTGSLAVNDGNVTLTPVVEY